MTDKEWLLLGMFLREVKYFFIFVITWMILAIVGQRIIEIEAFSNIMIYGSLVLWATSGITKRLTRENKKPLDQDEEGA